MAGLQRFISYIYKYENDEKKTNVGFAKVEVRGSICRIEVHIRNISIDQSEGMVYLFIRKEEKIQGIPVGNIPISRGNGDVRYTFEAMELMKFGIGMEQAEGIYISLKPGIYLASQWKEGEIAESLFRILEKQDAFMDEKAEAEKIEEKVQEQKNDEIQTDEGETIMQPDQIMQENNQEEVEENNAAEDEMDTIHTTEIPMEQYNSRDESWQRLFQKLRLKYTIFYPFEGQPIECIRMELKDLRELPEKHWYLGNNSFLLHGFFNYGHFIIGEMEELGRKEYLVGVPGVFQNQERIMAAMFGFPEFRTANDVEVKTGNFGYWYRII